MPDEKVKLTMRARVLCPKICRNQNLSHASSDRVMVILMPMMKLFAMILNNNGSQANLEKGTFLLSCKMLIVNKYYLTGSPKILSQIRLQAMVSLLQLSTTANNLTPQVSTTCCNSSGCM